MVFDGNTQQTPKSTRNLLMFNRFLYKSQILLVSDDKHPRSLVPKASMLFAQLQSPEMFCLNTPSDILLYK